jgi:hypothetical protein
MGDVLEVDLKTLVINALLANQPDVQAINLDGAQFALQVADVFAYGDDYFPEKESEQPAYKLITVKGASDTPTANLFSRN